MDDDIDAIITTVCQCGRAPDVCICAKPCDSCEPLTDEELLARHGLTGTFIAMDRGPLPEGQRNEK